MNPQDTPQLTPHQKMAAGRKLLEAEVVSRAWADEAFREKLQTDPASALAEAGIPLPEGKTIRVIFEEPDTVRISLPSAPETSAEASDAELEAVAGGGLIQNGKCQLYENSRKRETGQTMRFLMGSGLLYGSFIGVSWGWG